MIYTNANKTDSYIELSDGGNNIMILPTSATILVDDNSNLISVKNVASRKTCALLNKSALNAE